MSKILIAYYSRKGQNYVNGSIKKSLPRCRPSIPKAKILLVRL